MLVLGVHHMVVAEVLVLVLGVHHMGVAKVLVLVLGVHHTGVAFVRKRVPALGLLEVSK